MMKTNFKEMFQNKKQLAKIRAAQERAADA